MLGNKLNKLFIHFYLNSILLIIIKAIYYYCQDFLLYLIYLINYFIIIINFILIFIKN